MPKGKTAVLWQRKALSDTNNGGGLGTASNELRAADASLSLSGAAVSREQSGFELGKTNSKRLWLSLWEMVIS